MAPVSVPPIALPDQRTAWEFSAVTQQLRTVQADLLALQVQADNDVRVLREKIAKQTLALAEIQSLRSVSGARIAELERQIRLLQMR